jgi:hypothetical protein
MFTDFIDEVGVRIHVEDGKDQVLFVRHDIVQQLQIKFSSNKLFEYYSDLARYELSPNNLHMTVAEFDHLSGIIYAESSIPKSSKDDYDFREPAAIYGVLRNRANANGTSILDEANEKNVAGNQRTDEITDKNAPDSKVRAVYLGMALSIVTGRDWSIGAYFWQGGDFSISSRPANKGFYQTGFKFTSPDHDIWKMGDHIANDKVKTGNKKYDYKYESTATYGRTTFIRLTETWLKANGVTRWNGMTK